MASTSSKVGIGLALALVGFMITSTTLKAQNLDQQFKLYAGVPSNISISGGNLKFNAPVSITNQSAFDVTITNLFVNISYKDSNGTWQDLFYQPNGISAVTFKKGTTTNLNTIPLQMPLSNALVLVQLITGKLTGKLKITTRFQVQGLQLAPIETEIDAKAYVQPIISVLKGFGLLGEAQPAEYLPSELGYSSNSFHSRVIKDASHFEPYISKSKGKETKIRSNGSAYDTIEDMAKIVGETLYQTKELSKTLEGKTKEESVKNVYTWLHDHIQYNRDKEGVEQLREPAASFADRKTGIDCDCFSIFASSLLTNLGIDHYIEMCQIKPNPWFVHVYVVVPKTPKASLDNRSNYWVVDPCLHSFDELAKNISIKYDKAMYTTRLSGLDCPGSSCTCPPKNNGSFGKTEPKPVQFLKPGDLEKMELQVLEPLRQTLIRTKTDAIKNPASVSLIYNPATLVKGIDYALANWGDARKRAAALDILAKQDEAITNRPMVNGLMGIGAFSGLGSAFDPTMQYPLIGLDQDDNFQIEGLGGLFSSIKKTANSVKGFVVNNANKAVTALKDAGKATGTAIANASKAVATKVAEGAKFVAQNAMKVLPLAIVGRTAYRGLVALNFRGYATNLAKAISTPAGQKKIQDFWTSPFVGGNYADLMSAVNAGKSKKPLLGGLGELGVEPVTTTASVAAATPIIAKITAIINDALKIADSGSKVGQKVQQVQSQVQKVQNTVQQVKQTAQSVQQLIPGKNSQAPIYSSPSIANEIQVPGIDPNVQARENQALPQASYAPAYQSEVKTGSSGIAMAIGAALVAIAAIAFSSTSDKPKKGKQLNGLPTYSI